MNEALFPSFDDFINLLEKVKESPWLLLFFAIFVIGGFLKKYTRVKREFIPYIVILLSIILSLVLIEKSLTGAILGLIVGWIEIGLYEHVKNTTRIYQNGNGKHKNGNNGNNGKDGEKPKN